MINRDDKDSGSTHAAVACDGEKHSMNAYLHEGPVNKATHAFAILREGTALNSTPVGDQVEKELT
ncbi:hypothetical protein [Nocardia brasiliensis]|uniref:Uncharacterized protein n=1 Tax=Nocardia brasiliensis (strain ATCC 700358 / HUJEG-1) TaxID=1133849 RepID=K0F6L5_NOCB7|nr:hypothetical protein [Nocardia brasiliensis]AFU05299.1 hypothetical protein O3I_036760 [Nocardia brasiliensis ATCC 700358]OCF87985.1 hypothetical protein AW168_23385 [Nocardia brasiliensis]